MKFFHDFVLSSYYRTLKASVDVLERGDRYGKRKSKENSTYQLEERRELNFLLRERDLSGMAVF